MSRFKRHEFTCEDVIYLRNRKKKAGIAQVAIALVFTAAISAYGYFSEQKERAKFVD